jgi:hypothetical protein
VKGFIINFYYMSGKTFRRILGSVVLCSVLTMSLPQASFAMSPATVAQLTTLQNLLQLLQTKTQQLQLLSASTVSPMMSITSPVAEAFYSGTVTLNAVASTSFTSFTWSIDGVTLATQSTKSQYILDTTKYVNGPHSVQAIGIDKAGVTYKSEVWFTIWNQITTSASANSTSVTLPVLTDQVDNVDAPPALIKNGATTYWFSTFGGPDKGWRKYTGTTSMLFQQKLWEKTGAQIFSFATQPKSTSTPYDHIWLSHVYQQGQDSIGFIHIENKMDVPMSDPNPIKGRIGLAYSHDYGDTWKYLGDIMVPYDLSGSQNTPGTPFIVKDGYIYAYYDETMPQANGYSNNGLAVMRADLNSVMTAAVTGKSVPWYKYYNGAWTSPAVSGLATLLTNVPVSGHISTDAFYSSYTKKYYILLSQSANATRPAILDLYESTDALHFTFTKRIATRSWSGSVNTSQYDGYNYPTITSADGTDTGVVNRSFYVYAPNFIPDKTPLSIYRYMVTLGDATVVTTAPTTYTHSDGFNVTGTTNVWKHYYRDTAGSLVPLSWSTTNSAWTSTTTGVSIYSTSALPGTNNSAVISWVAPAAGQARITTAVSDQNTTCGDGVSLKLLKGSSVVWTGQLKNGDTAGISIDYTSTTKTGDTLNVEVTKGVLDNKCDLTRVNPVVVFTPQ